MKHNTHKACGGLYSSSCWVSLAFHPTYPNTIFETEIPVNVAVARAVDEFKPVVLTEPQSTGAKAFNLSSLLTCDE